MLIFFSKIIVGVGLLWLVLNSVDFKSSFEILKGVQVKYLLYCGALLNFDRFFMAFKWSILLDYRCRFLSIILPLTRSYYYSRLLSPFVPSTVGEDFVRGVSLLKEGIDKEKLVSSIVVERLLGAISHLILVVFTLVLLLKKYDNTSPLYLYVTLFLTCIIIAITFFPFYFSPQKILGNFQLPNWKVCLFAKETFLAYKDYRTKKKKIFLFLFLSIVENSFAVLGSYWFFLSVDVAVSLYDMLLTVPAVLFFSKIPLSIGAIGIQEGCYVLFFSMIGVSAEQAVVVSLVGRVVDIIAISPGCLMFYIGDIIQGYRNRSDIALKCKRS